MRENYLIKNLSDKKYLYYNIVSNIIIIFKEILIIF